MQETEPTVSGDDQYACLACCQNFASRSLLQDHLATHVDVDPQSVMSHTGGTQHDSSSQSESSDTPVDSLQLGDGKDSNGTTLNLIDYNKFIVYHCKVCNERFSDPLALQKHRRIHKPKNFVCDVCEKRFEKTAYLRAHQRSHTGERPFLCTHCEKTFAQRTQLQRHILSHTGERPYACEHCIKTFKRSEHLQNHVRITHMDMHSIEVKYFPCSMCEKQFTHRPNLVAHERTHTGERPCVCKQCGKAFGKSSHLTVHMRIHTGERPYSCSQCDKKFVQIGAAQRHEATHRNERPFSCIQCGKAFGQASDLRRHLQLHLRDGIARGLSEQSLTAQGAESDWLNSVSIDYGCGLCGEMFNLCTDAKLCYVKHCYP